MPVEKLQRKLFEASARGIIARLEPIEFLGLVLRSQVTKITAVINYAKFQPNADSGRD